MTTNQTQPQIPEFVIRSRYVVEGLLLPTVGLVGIVGNLVTLLVISRSELGLKMSVKRLISQLCVLDTLIIIFNIVMFSCPWHSEYYRLQILPVMIPVLLGLTQMSLTGSVFTILVVAIERLVAVSRPHYQLPDRASWISCLAIIVFAVSVNFSKLFEYRTETVSRTFPSNLVISGAWPVSEENHPETVTWQWRRVQPTSLRQCQVYSKISNLLSICLNLLTFIALLGLNLCIYIKIKKKRSVINSSQRVQRDLSIAAILVTIVMMFAVCHSCKALISVIELWAVLSGNLLENRRIYNSRRRNQVSVMAVGVLNNTFDFQVESSV